MRETVKELSGEHQKKVEGIGSDEVQFKCGMETEDRLKEDAERVYLG